MEHIHWDVLVVGSGAAGLRAAIAAHNKGLRVCVISKGLPGMGTSTVLSYGIFAAAMEGGSLEEHRERTLQAGRGINQQELVHALVEEGPLRLQELLGWGIRAVARRNSLFVKGRPLVWGKEIVQCLLARARMLGIQFMGGLLVWRVKMMEGMAGILAYSSVRRKWIGFSSRALILATGGAGALFLRHDNPQRMLGDGYTLALDAGAVLQDMEFVQFHPTGLAEPGLPPILIPSTVVDRGRLINGRGEEILAKYKIKDQFAAERARDQLSRVISQEIIREGEEVWLDLRAISEEKWVEDPPSAAIREILWERYEVRNRPLRVAPVAHHVMGGVRIDPRGASSVPGLFAAGEVTGGLHGANRLRGNALTETLVYGARAGEAAAAWAKTQRAIDQRMLLKGLCAFLPKFHTDTVRLSATKLKQRLREVLWECAGTIRNRQGLLRAQDEVARILEDARRLSPGNDPRELQRTLELHHGARTALLIIKAALRREESRGAHFRDDFPEQDDERWRGHILICLSQKGEERWSFEPLCPHQVLPSTV